MSSIPLQNHRFEDICPRFPLKIIDLRTHVLDSSGEHRCEDICSPFPLKIIDVRTHVVVFLENHRIGTVRFQPSSVGSAQNICSEHMFQLHRQCLCPRRSRTVTSPVLSTPRDLGVCVSGPHWKSSIWLYISSLRLGNHRFEDTCPRSLSQIAAWRTYFLVGP